MKKSEFREIIAEASYLISNDFEGVCIAIEEMSSSNTIYRYFHDMLHPRSLKGRFIIGIDKRFGFWLGHQTKKNVELRLTFLAMFEVIVLENKKYREW